MFGGTFDPVHIGHLVTALEVRHAMQLDRMLLVPANVPWQKADRVGMASADDRVAMLCAALGDVDGLEVSTVDIDRGGATYTADTLRDVARTIGDEPDPEPELFLVVGSDVASELHTWVRPDEVRALATLVVVPRGGASAEDAARLLGAEGWQCAVVDVPALDVSSSMVRERIADGRPIDFLVPAASIHWIRERGLYARSR